MTSTTSPPPLAIQVNGSTHPVACSPSTPLLYALRNDLSLRGTRFGCGTGHCGACTVQLDGQAVQSCDTPVWAVLGHEVTTIEGIGRDSLLHPLQAAFLDEQAAQCGYCINGIIMSAKALLEKTPSPTEADVKHALQRHLCRCGAHVRILRAVLKASRSHAGRDL